MTSKTEGEEKFTLEEFRELFGDEIPIEVMKFVWEASDDMTIREVRSRVYEMAASSKRMRIVE